MPKDHQTKPQSKLLPVANGDKAETGTKLLRGKHIPVLLDEVLQTLSPSRGESLLDVTAGYGGHASAILERTLQYDGSVLVDRDSNATKELNQKFKDNGVRVMQANFAEASTTLLSEGKQFDMIVADLGVSSPHLDNPDRGFSLKNEGPLDMRMDSSQALSAETLVNEADEQELVRILKVYGEEPRGKRIASAIIDARPLQSTTELAQVVEKALHTGWHKAHPATKTFQALRIAVNDELKLLEQALPLWLRLLSPNGRLVIISFHSLEDRLAKQFLAEHSKNAYEADLRLLTKKPTTASAHELVLNPRARSAKLRAAVKINKKKEGADT